MSPCEMEAIVAAREALVKELVIVTALVIPAVIVHTTAWPMVGAVLAVIVSTVLEVATAVQAVAAAVPATVHVKVGVVTVYVLAANVRASVSPLAMVAGA